MTRHLALYMVQGGRCFYCGAEMTVHRTRRGGPWATMDHVRPRLANGHQPPFVVACLSCNGKKSGRDPTAQELARAWPVFTAAEALRRRLIDHDLGVRLRLEVVDGPPP